MIRRTIHIIRHEPGAAMRGPRVASAVAVSGSHGVLAANGSGGVATRTSGSRGGATGLPTGASAPVSTGTSGSHGPSSSPAPAGSPVSTRSSGSHGGSSGGSSGTPVTRTSGSGGHGDGGDGGDGTAVATTKPKASLPAGPDRLTVVMFTLAAFLGVLALLSWQSRAAPSVRIHSPVVLRRVYETRVIETLVGSPGGGASVTQSVSSSGSTSSLAAAPTTRSS